MDKENKKLLKIVLVCALAGGILWWIMKHNTFTEGLSHRLTTTSELLPLIYSTSMKESPYYQKWEYEMEIPNMIEGYSDMYTCEKACANVLGDTPRQDCIEYCQNKTLIANQNDHPIGCNSNSQCPDGSVCVNPGFYNNGEGFCLATLEPGVEMPATLNPALRRLTPAWSPLTPGFAPLTPAWSPLTPGFAPLDPSLQQLNPAWSPLTPGLAPLDPSLQQLNPAWSPLVPSMQPSLPPMRPLNPAMGSVTPVIGNLTPAWGEIVPRPTALTPAFQQIVPPLAPMNAPSWQNIVRKDKVGSQYAITSCPVGQFFDHNAQCCQPRLQEETH